MGEGNWSRADGEEDLLGRSEANRSQCLQTQTVSDPILLGHWELEWLSQDLSPELSACLREQCQAGRPKGIAKAVVQDAENDLILSLLNQISQ